MSSTDTHLAINADILPDAVLLVNLDGQVLQANQAGRALLQCSDTDSPDLTSRLADPTEPYLRTFLTRCAGNLSPLPGRIDLRTASGQIRRLHVTGSRIDAQRPLILLRCEDIKTDAVQHRFTGLNETIDQLRNEINSRRRAETLLEAEKRVLAEIVGGSSLQDALETLSTAIEANSDGLLVSILLLEDGRLRHAAAPSLPQRYIEAIDGVQIGPQVGSCGTAAYTDKTVVVSDIATDPKWANFRELALRDNLQACWSTPIRSPDGNVLGTLALYYRSEREPTPAELLLIKNSAHTAGLAIERHRARDELQVLLDSERFERERAENEIRAKDRFLAILSHELRNPLAAIANAAQAIEAAGELAGSTQSMQAIIVNETSMLKRILDDLLDISRLNSGKMILKNAPVDMADCLHDAVAACRISHPDRRFELNCADALGVVDGDNARLQQTITNLLDNAVKYSPDDTAISIDATIDADSIEIAVRDQGEGIDPQLLPRIFDPFIQSDESLERSRSGLGLGLPLVKQLAQLHGGSISAYSEGRNRGSLFVLRLPASTAELPVESASQSSNAHSDGTARRVLIVEDNANARDGLCRILSIWGHDVRSAEDGEAALDLMRADPPDVAFIDIGLPKMDGYALARAIRSDDGTSPSTRLIALTGYGQEQDRQRAIEAGFEMHLVKPVDVDDLRRIIEG